MRPSNFELDKSDLVKSVRTEEYSNFTTENIAADMSNQLNNNNNSASTERRQNSQSCRKLESNQPGVCEIVQPSSSFQDPDPSSSSSSSSNATLSDGVSRDSDWRIWATQLLNDSEAVVNML
ncbi:unnamed protein product, partial [Trichobilharzia szidati]